MKYTSTLAYMAVIFTYEFEYGLQIDLTDENQKEATSTEQQYSLKVATNTRSPLKLNRNESKESPVAFLGSTSTSLFNNTDILSDGFVTYDGQDNKTTLREYGDKRNQGCIDNIRASSGNISSPVFIEEYNANTQCDWIIIVPQKLKVRLKFTVFNLPPKTNERCLNGYVEIGGFDENGQRIVHKGHYCGDDAPEDYEAPDNRCWVYFFSQPELLGNKSYSFSFNFNAVLIEDAPTVSSRIGLLALLVILVPIVCSVITYCCLKKRRITKMEFDYYNRFRSKHTSIRRTEGDQIQIRVSRPSEEEYTDEVSFINSTFQYDMLPDKQKNFHVYRVMRPSNSRTVRSSDGSVFLHNTLDQDNICSRGSFSTSSGQFLSIPGDTNVRPSYLSLRSALESNNSNSRRISTTVSSSTDTLKVNRQLKFRGQSSKDTPEYIRDNTTDHITPVIYVQNPDKCKPIDRTNSGSCLGLRLDQCYNQTLIKSEFEEEPSLTDLNIRKFKDRSKSLSLPTQCFLPQQADSRVRLLSERHHSLRLKSSSWGEARTPFDEHSFAEDLKCHSATPFFIDRFPRDRQLNMRKPSISRPPRLEALPEVEQSDSISSGDNQFKEEICTAIPKSSTYLQDKGQHRNIKDFETTPYQNNGSSPHRSEDLEKENPSCHRMDENLTRNKVDEKPSQRQVDEMTKTGATESDFQPTLNPIETNLDHHTECALQNRKWPGTQSERILCKNNKQGSLRQLSFQERMMKHSSETNLAPDNQRDNLKKILRAKSAACEIGVLRVDERNESLNMLKNYDMPDSQHDDPSQSESFEEDKHMQYSFTEEKRCSSYFHKEQTFSSEGYNSMGNASYIVPKMKNTSKVPRASRRHSYRPPDIQTPSFNLNSSKTNFYVPDNSVKDSMQFDETRYNFSMQPDETRYSSFPQLDQTRFNSNIQPDESRYGSFAHPDQTRNSNMQPDETRYGSFAHPDQTRNSNMQPDETRYGSFGYPDQTRNSSYMYPDQTRYHSFVRGLTRTNSYVVDESSQQDLKRSNSYTHGTSMSIHIQADTSRNSSCIPNQTNNNPYQVDTAGHHYMPEVSRSNSFEQYAISRNNIYLPEMSRNMSHSYLPDGTRNISYMFEMTRNASYMQEMNVNASFVPETSQAYDLRFETSHDPHESQYFDGNRSVSVDINNNTDENPSVAMYSDFYPNRSGFIVLEEGESMV